MVHVNVESQERDKDENFSRKKYRNLTSGEVEEVPKVTPVVRQGLSDKLNTQR